MKNCLDCGQPCDDNAAICDTCLHDTSPIELVDGVMCDNLVAEYQEWENARDRERNQADR